MLTRSETHSMECQWMVLTFVGRKGVQEEEERR